MESGFPSKNEDKKYLSRISSIEVKPVFVMGFHRSGTTFVYDSVSRCFPFANLDLYHIFFYERLLSNKINGNEKRDREWFNQYIRDNDIKDRGLDGFEVCDSMVEEYCWVMSKGNRVFPVAKTRSWDCERLKQVCQKVLFCSDGAERILLKNPFDFDNAETLLKYFPDARFIYVKRKPSEILNSNLHAFVKMSRPHPFFRLMQTTQPAPVRFIVSCLSKYMYTLSEEQVISKVTFNVQKAIQKKLAAVKKSLENIPRDRYVVVDYEEFTRDPAHSLHQVRDMLGIEFSTSPDVIEPKPRKTRLLEAAQRYADVVDSCSF